MIRTRVRTKQEKILEQTALSQSDPEVFEILQKERARQQNKLSMIPSENFFSAAVREAVGSEFMHKYSEGNVGQRYYEGNEHIDELEQLAIARAKKAFNLPADWDVNVQALSGSNANLAVYLAVLKMGDLMMSMYLPDGGHLSHGWSFEPDSQKRTQESGSLVYKGGSRKVNITAKMYRVIQYKTDLKTQQFNYVAIEAIAQEYKPNLLITGGTAYPRLIDHKRMREIAHSVGALYLADIAHEAGLVAGSAFPSPVGIADIVTMTTHKTLRAGRGAIILANADLIKKINRAILPGLQGGPHNHNIAGICVGLGEALHPGFKDYAQQVIANAKHLAEALIRRGFTLVSGGTDKHLVLIDLSNQPILGRPFARALDLAGVVTNYSTIPGDARPPRDPSGLRLGTPWLTTRGMKEPQMEQVADWMSQVMNICTPRANLSLTAFEAWAASSAELKQIAKEVHTLCARFPLS